MRPRRPSVKQRDTMKGQKANNALRRLGKDDGAYPRGEEHDDGRQYVGQDVAPQDTRGGRTGRLGGVHVHVLAHRDDRAAYDARTGDAEQQAQRNDDLRHAGPDDRHDHDEDDEQSVRIHCLS